MPDELNVHAINEGPTIRVRYPSKRSIPHIGCASQAIARYWQILI
jgi:hypothetical protein